MTDLAIKLTIRYLVIAWLCYLVGVESYWLAAFPGTWLYCRTSKDF